MKYNWNKIKKQLIILSPGTMPMQAFRLHLIYLVWYKGQKIPHVKLNYLTENNLEEQLYIEKERIQDLIDKDKNILKITPAMKIPEEYKGYGIHVDMDRGYTISAPLDARVIMSDHRGNPTATPKQHIEIAKQIIDNK